jgi:predicted permease
MRPFWSALPPNVRRLFRLPRTRARLIHELDEELDTHLAMRIEELRQRGLSESDAAAEARRRFGDHDEFREYAVRRAERRAQRLDISRWIEESGQDLRAATRQFQRSPAVSAVIVLTLALCIGATTAIYSVVRHLLLAPLPYAEGNRIASLEARSDGDGVVRWHVSTDLYRLWADRSRTLEDFAAANQSRYAVGDRGARDSAAAILVTPSFLPMLRVRPSLGRGFTADDARRGAPAVALIGDAAWRERFGRARDVIGRSISIDGTLRTVVGVVPPAVGLPVQQEDLPSFWLPLNLDSANDVGAFARLRDGVTSAAASRELDAIRRTLPDTGRLAGRRGEARTAPDRVDPQRRRGVEVLFVAAIGLLLIACADVAGLLLMRAWTRRRELAIRQALGAGRRRLARQLLTESLLLAVPSGALGLFIAWLGLRGAGYLVEAPLNMATLLWTATASVSTALLFGAGPVLFAWERSLDGALRSGGIRSGMNRPASRAHAGLVVCQIALSLVFLAATGVLARSFVSLLRTPIGYEADGLIALSVARTPASTQTRAPRLTPAERAAVVRTLHETLAATPGVSEVAVGTLPMTNIRMGPTAVEGPSGVRPTDVPITGAAFVSSEYFRVAGISLLRGRGFEENSAAAVNEVVVNQALARRLWPDRDALGARLRLGDGREAEWLTVVGIAGDVQMPGSTELYFGLQMYRPTSAAPTFAGSFVLRARGDATTLRPLLARAVERADVGATLRKVDTAESTLGYAFNGPRFALTLFAAFALLAVALAAVGLYGIVAFAVARRSREIGIRVVLGADPTGLTRTIVGQTLALVAAGCAIGLIAAYGAGRGLSALLVDVSPNDPAALGGAMMLLALIAVGASVVPVRRALSVDPTDTLRAE